MVYFSWKNKQDITSHIGYFRPKNIDKIPYVWYYKYEFSMNIAIKFLPLSLLSALTAPVGYRAEMQDDAHINVAFVAMKDTVVNESTVVEDSEIVRM